MTDFIPKITLDGSTKNDSFIKFTQNQEWTSSNYCLFVNNGYTNLNGLIINGSDTTDTIYTSTNTQNMSFNVTGNNNIIFKTNNTERLRIFNTGNIGIGVITATSYKLNVSGPINSTLLYKNEIELDNIYLLIKNNFWLLDKTTSTLYTDPNSNINKIGIGNTEPLGYLHIGSPSVRNTDANFVLSKNKNDVNRNFKLGYDDTFNFIFGDFDAITWKKQFYINNNAPENSLVIFNDGNIGIGTTNSSGYKVNINGTLRATSLTGDGANVINLNYNNITTNRPNLANLDNWIYNAANNIIYTNPSYFSSSSIIGIGYTTTPNAVGDTTTYKLSVNGNIYSKTGFFINGQNISSIYLSITNAASSYVTNTVFNASNLWITNYTARDGNHITLISQQNDRKLLLGIAGSSSATVLLDVYGTIQSKYFSGDGNGLTNINYDNIRASTIPDYLEATALNDYYNKNYLDTTYYNNIFITASTLYAANSVIADLEAQITSVYASLDLDAVAEFIKQLATTDSLSIYYSNIKEVPFNYNIINKNFGFNTQPTINDKISIIGNLKVTGLINCTSNIYENNSLLSDIYISSNRYHTSIANYDTIINRKKSHFTSEKLYPPSTNSLFDNTNLIIISQALYGNGTYKIESSTNFMILALGNNTANNNQNIPAFNLFNNDDSTTPWTIGEINKYSSTPPYSILDPLFSPTNAVIKNILYTKVKDGKDYYGHWILLNYSEKFIISKIDIIINTAETPNAPKKITLLGTNNNVFITNDYTTNYTTQQLDLTIWDILIDNVVISSYTPKLTNTSISTATINIPDNIKQYGYYKLIVTEITGSLTALKIQQLNFYGFEIKKEWVHSGTNIYSLSNISIKTIDDLSPYSLNVNGDIYSSSNIYANSNIGIGNTSPLGNLHIASPNTISDGTLIISKKDNINNRNFKFGYDDNFNFSFGDFVSPSSWIKQFYINSNAPENSLIINNLGNVGIGTNNISLNQKLYVKGNVTITGTISQTDYNTSNIFNSDIYASNNMHIISNLNVNGILYASQYIGINTSSDFKASLNIQSDVNKIGIWNASYNLGTNKYISSFIGKNNSSKNGFYNHYYHSGDTNNANYLSWSKNIIPSSDDILCITVNNNIGIGITNPTALFQIGNGGKFKISPNDNDYALIGLSNIDSSLNTKIFLSGGINQRIEYYASNGGHIFYTSSSSEKMRINNSGNIGIGTTSDIYLLNANGHIYSSSNIYANSNIGIGNTSPLGNLHIASPNTISDGTLIISKKDNINNRNFKFGYDENFNFSFGDFVSPASWIKQFYINSNAPANSLIINNLGNVGIGTNNISLNQKIYIKGNETVEGVITQIAADGNPNTFQNAICIGTTDTETNQLNVNGSANIKTSLTTVNFRASTETILNGKVRINALIADESGYNVYINNQTLINGELHVKNRIKENNSYLNDIYVQLANLNNLSLNNFNLKKKFGYKCVTTGETGAIIFNSINYYKFDIDLRQNTRYLINTIGINSVCYRSFNIKCFLTDGSFETFNNGTPNILQYDVYMSSNPIAPFCYPSMTTPKSGLNICAIGTPENYKLDNILPSYISLLRNDNNDYMFNYLSVTSPCSNLQVSYIIEDYLT